MAQQAQQAQLAQQRLLGPALSPANGSGDNIVSLRGGAIYSIPQVIQWHTCPEAKPLHIRPGPGFHARWPLCRSWLEANRARAQGILYRPSYLCHFPTTIPARLPHIHPFLSRRPCRRDICLVHRAPNNRTPHPKDIVSWLWRHKLCNNQASLVANDNTHSGRIEA